MHFFNFYCLIFQIFLKFVARGLRVVLLSTSSVGVLRRLEEVRLRKDTPLLLDSVWTELLASVNCLGQVFLVDIVQLVPDVVILIFVPVKVNRACLFLLQGNVSVEYQSQVLLGCLPFDGISYFDFLLDCQLLLDRVMVLEMEVFELY